MDYSTQKTLICARYCLSYPNQSRYDRRRNRGNRPLMASKSLCIYCSDRQANRLTPPVQFKLSAVTCIYPCTATGDGESRKEKFLPHSFLFSKLAEHVRKFVEGATIRPTALSNAGFSPADGWLRDGMNIFVRSNDVANSSLSLPSLETGVPSPGREVVAFLFGDGWTSRPSNSDGWEEVRVGSAKILELLQLLLDPNER
jgi:hypothetical protein